MEKREKVTLLATLLRGGELLEPDSTWLTSHSAPYKMDGKTLWNQILKPLFLTSLEQMSREDRERFSDLLEVDKKAIVQSWAESSKTRSDVAGGVHCFLGQQARATQLARQKELIERPREVEELREENAELKRKVAPMEKKLQKKEKELEEFRKTNKQLKQDIGSVQALLDSQHDENASLAYKSQQLQKKLQEVEVVSTEEGQRYERAPTQPAKTEEDVGAVRRWIAHLFTDATQDALQERIKRLEEDNEYLWESNKVYAGQVTDLLFQKGCLETRNQVLEEQSARLLHENNELLSSRFSTPMEPVTVKESIDVVDEVHQEALPQVTEPQKAGSQEMEPSKEGINLRDTLREFLADDSPATSESEGDKKGNPTLACLPATQDEGRRGVWVV